MPRQIIFFHLIQTNENHSQNDVPSEQGDEWRFSQKVTRHVLNK